MKIVHYCRDNATNLSDVLVTATSVPCNTRYPLRIKKPYTYLASRIPDVPEGMIIRILFIIAIAIVFIWNILTGTGSLTSWHMFQCFFHLHDSATKKGRKNPRHQKWKRQRSRKQICKKKRFLPEINVKALATSNNNDDNDFLFDTYGISFVSNKYATKIICNVRKLFIGPMRTHHHSVAISTYLYSSKVRYGLKGTNPGKLTGDFWKGTNMNRRRERSQLSCKIRRR